MNEPNYPDNPHSILDQQERFFSRCAPMIRDPALAGNKVLREYIEQLELTIEDLRRPMQGATE